MVRSVAPRNGTGLRSRRANRARSLRQQSPAARQGSHAPLRSAVIPTLPVLTESKSSRRPVAFRSTASMVGNTTCSDPARTAASASTRLRKKAGARPRDLRNRPAFRNRPTPSTRAALLAKAAQPLRDAQGSEQAHANCAVTIRIPPHYCAACCPGALPRQTAPPHVRPSRPITPDQCHPPLGGDNPVRGRTDGQRRRASRNGPPRSGSGERISRNAPRFRPRCAP